MVWVESIVCQNCLIRGEDGAEGEALNVRILFSGLDDLVKDCDIYWRALVTARSRMSLYSLSSVSGGPSSTLLCSSESGASGGIDSIGAYHASTSKA